ncbi:DUF58 domain-containing protein [Methanoculleus sp. Wushi-C6]|uniref:DUF58 domain-containing protein n=1 Tax=Methanoculleus caldifontis TaxID=2651577 RepID=A0ABU3WZF2_9EURY|nr:DUF58 domain-containing protein [Methanoculleus sp. Wushi-C6]MDV2481178.1 DUF58 domain-containing protein [Methanoculleus sp. Wushi-C6]
MIRPTRTSGGVAALALALTVTALLLANPAAALAAGSLALFLFWRGWRFEQDLAAAAASLAVTREVDRTILRQGTAATVRVKADLAVPAGMEVRVRDLPPAVAAGDAPLSPPGTAATYTVRLMAPGETAFRGVVLSASDAFFSRDLVCRRHDAPQIRVFPAGTTESGRGTGATGSDAEVDRRAALAGQGIRGFRPYQMGDDPGLIDWKVTARRDAYYVRQPSGLEGGSPLIAVDLPARAADPEAFARFSMAVCGAVEGAISARDGCSLLVVAGGEVVRFLPRTLDIRDAIAALGGLAPLEPRSHLYRAPGPAALAGRARMNGRGAEDWAFREKFGGVLAAFAAESPAPFAAAVRAAFGRAEASEIRIYSLLPPGDKSHLVQLAREAKVRGMRVVLKAPAGAGALPGIDAVEVL